ncbi:MAG: chitobiase/beta-hexosaminidase C-terminal domain-containing protein [Verrucomicrobia bacterium]|nr:chitobiase/beta-hexosaminidase C-terminal domain-containing protein [Verrucomicrobiota bacterium]MCH8526980.1 chitobiase/beta-hexosaminidase C-terminal domain-containing protein [Kiritimatiellia bacterium]
MKIKQHRILSTLILCMCHTARFAVFAGTEPLFSERRDEESVTRLARRFFSFIDLERDELASVRSAYGESAWLEALEAYRDFFFERLTEMDEQHWGWMWGYDNLSRNWADPEVPPRAEQWADGDRGLPGEIDWSGFGMHPDQEFHSLLRAYLATGEERFLHTWADVTDDWTLRDSRWPNLAAADLKDADFSGMSLNSRLYVLRAVGIKAPGGGREVPATTLARYLLRLVVDQQPHTVPYLRSNPQNWTTLGATGMLVSGVLLDRLGFKPGERYTREGLRLVESQGATQQLPDGVDQEQNLHYMKHYVEYTTGPVSGLIRDLYPDLRPEAWLEELEHHGNLRMQFALRMLTPRGRYSPGNRRDTRDRAGEAYRAMHHAPAVLENENNRRILDLTWGRDTPQPDFNSEAYPFGGFYNLRSGWGRQDQQGYLFTSPQPANSTWRTRRGNNVFTLSAFDQELIVARQVGTYDEVHSPVRVNDRQQDFHAVIPAWEHRHRMTTAWDQPADGRWHDSERFALAETTYAGPFEDMDGEISHRRKIVFLKEPGVWIVLDHLRAADEERRTFTQEWVLPVQPVNPGRAGADYKAFTFDSIRLDEAEQVIATEDEGMANLTFLQIGTGPLRFEKREVEVEDGGWYRPKLSNFGLIRTHVEGGRDTRLISVIYPRPEGVEGFASAVPVIENREEAGEVLGGSVAMPDGTRIEFRDRGNGPAVMTVAGHRIEAESALVVTAPDGGKSGLIFGAASMEAPDFEFTIGEEGFLDAIPIHRPIQPVRIDPAQPVFHDTLTVRLRSDSEGVEIRYTLDGTEPTPAATLYEEPFVLEGDAVVKARAFRPGVDEVSDVMSGTHATGISRAFFEKRPLRAAERVETAQPGLRSARYEGNWQELFTGLDRLSPVGEARAEGLFDPAPGRMDIPFALRYTGYIQVSEPGIYTVQAPEELILNSIMGGYELRIFVGEKEWYPSTRRHAFGLWTIGLEKGLHPLRVDYVDFRGDTPERYNRPGFNDLIWTGDAPEVRISGPGTVEFRQ